MLYDYARGDHVELAPLGLRLPVDELLEDTEEDVAALAAAAAVLP